MVKVINQLKKTPLKRNKKEKRLKKEKVKKELKIFVTSLFI